MEKVKKENIIKRWYKLCEPNKKYMTLQILSYAIHAIIYALMTVFAAKTIDCLYNGDWKNAFIWLGIEFLDILVRNLVLHYEFWCYGKIYGGICKTITSKICDKVFSVSDAALKKFSPEKIINIAQSNTGKACEFPDFVANMVSNIMQVGVALVAIFTASWWAGLIVIALGVVNFLVYDKLNKRLGFHLQKRFERKDDRFREYSRIISSKNVISELGAQEQYKEKLLYHVDGFNKEYNKYYMMTSFKDNLYYVIWNFVIYALTAVLIYFISKNMFDLALYLILVPYLKSCTEKLTTLYSKFGGIESMRVDVDRVNLILSLSDKEMITYGNVNKDREGYNLSLANVSYQDKNSPDTKLKNANINFKMNDINIVRGERKCGKRIVFDLLRRTIKPDEGKIILDNLNLYDYNAATYKNHIDYCAQHPLFIKGTIKENLQATKRDLTKLDALIEELGLTQIIASLPNGLNTQIEDVTNNETRFWIGLIRAALSKCKVLMLYEYPETTNPEFKEIFDKIISTCETDKRTLILFTHNDCYDYLAGQVIEIVKGNCKIIKANKNAAKA